jgi:AmpD protein
MRICSEGLLEGGRYIASPNCDERPAGTQIELIVIHAISLPPGEFGGAAIEQLFLNTLDPAKHPYYAALAGLRVSSHFLVRRDGELIQFVPCLKRAWHAGVSQWHGRPDCNDYSVGIELEGCDERPFDAPQYEVLARLTSALEHAYSISAIAGHSDIAPGRKTDPGPGFDWSRFQELVASLRSTRAA